MSKLTTIRILLAAIAWGAFVTLPAKADLTESEECHVENIYHEARGEGWAGWALVKATVENRVADSRWPSTVCGVVYQDSQFSWTLSDVEVVDEEIWNRIATFVTEGTHSDFSGATHYHTVNISPWWARSYQYLGTVGKHKYYKQENVLFASILLTAVCIVITILLFDLLDDNIEDEDL